MLTLVRLPRVHTAHPYSAGGRIHHKNTHDILLPPSRKHTELLHSRLDVLSTPRCRLRLRRIPRSSTARSPPQTQRPTMQSTLTHHKLTHIGSSSGLLQRLKMHTRQRSHFPMQQQPTLTRVVSKAQLVAVRPGSHNGQRQVQHPHLLAMLNRALYCNTLSID